MEPVWVRCCPSAPGVFSLLPLSLRGHTYANRVLIVLPGAVLYPIHIDGCSSWYYKRGWVVRRQPRTAVWHVQNSFKFLTAPKPQNILSEFSCLAQAPTRAWWHHRRYNYANKRPTGLFRTVCQKATRRRSFFVVAVIFSLQPWKFHSSWPLTWHWKVMSVSSRQ